MARQMARAAAEADKSGGRTAGWARPGEARAKAAGTAKVAGQVKAVMAKKPAAPAKPKPTGPTPEELAKRTRDLHYRALVDPAAQEVRKKQHLEAFKKLQAMSLEDLQVEFIVCIRAEHYKDARMYSEIMLEKDPSNSLVAQFQPLLASMAVQANERLCESSSDSEDSDDDGDDDENGEGGGEGAEGAEQTENGVVESESDSDSDDPETAWMWSETWRTDPDDDEPPAPSKAS